MLPWRGAALTYRILFAAVTAWALGLLLDVDEGRFDTVVFVFFTALSNLACLVWAALSAAITARDGLRDGWHGASSPSPRAAGYPLMSIIVTMLIYLIVLTPTVPADELFTFEDTLVHVVVPVMMILDWLLFTPKGRLRWYDPLLWAIPPYVYLGWAFLHHATGGDFSGKPYPYPFMNVDRIGWDGFFIYALALTIGLEVVAYLIYGVDRLLSRGARRRVAG